MGTRDTLIDAIRVVLEIYAGAYEDCAEGWGRIRADGQVEVAVKLPPHHPGFDAAHDTWHWYLVDLAPPGNITDEGNLPLDHDFSGKGYAPLDGAMFEDAVVLADNPS